MRAEDADPFRFRSWLFGSIGDVDVAAFEGVRERVLESTPSFLRRNIRGLSASEHFFHLFLAFMHDAGILDQPTPPPTAVHAALRNSLAFVDRLLVSIGAPSLKIALATTNGRCFVATGCALPDALPPRRRDLRLPGLPRGQRSQRPQRERPAHPARGAARGRRRGQPRRRDRGPGGTTSPIARR